MEVAGKGREAGRIAGEISGDGAGDPDGWICNAAGEKYGRVGLQTIAVFGRRK